MTTPLAPPTPSATPVTAPLLQLRPYQREALRSIEQARGSGRRAALVCLPTGCGKTLIFSELVKRWDVPTVILAHRDELLTQARDKLLALWPTADVGLLGGGRHDLGHRVTIASVQALTRPRWLVEVAAQSIRLVIVDEAHHTPARSYRRVLATLGAGLSGDPTDAAAAQPVAGAFLVGVTATPQRFDELSLTPLFGEAVYVATLPQMVAEGWLADLRGVRVATGVSLAGVHVRGGDFAEGELADAVDTPERSALVVAAYLRHARGRSALAFCASVAHAEHLADLFAAAGARAAVVSGQTPKPERDQLLAAYGAGELDIVCNCQVLTEGFDAPVTSCIILARPTRSQGLYLQMVGRGTRPAPGKRDCVVLDVADASHSLVQLPDLLGRAYALPDLTRRPSPVSPRPQVDPAVDPAVAAAPESSTWSLREALATLERAPGASSDSSDSSGAPAREQVGRLVRVWDWARVGSAYALPLGEQRQAFTLEPAGGERYYAYRQTSQGRERLTPTPLALGWAQAVVESAAEKIASGQSVLVDRSAPWRQQPASEKQLWLMRKKRIKVPVGCTKGQAADLLDAFFARQRSHVS